MSEPRGWSPRLWGGWGVEPGVDGDADTVQLEQWVIALGEGCDYVSLSLPRDMLLAQLASVLCRTRRRMGLTQLQLAYRASSNMRTVSLLELEKQLPRIDTLAKLALALGVEPLLVFLPRIRDSREMGE